MMHDPPAAADDPTETGAEQASLPAHGKRRIDLHRRRAIITAGRIDVRPSRAAVIPPLLGFALGAGCVGLIVLGVTADAIPYWALALLLLVALVAVPLTGITLVYALVGANVIFDRAKQSATWQQGLLGMGIGTTELVPFWKIAAILVTEAGAPGGSPGRRVEEFAQWEVVLLKQSGKRLTVAGTTAPRRFAEYGLAPVQELANAISALTGAPVRIERPDLADAPPVDEAVGTLSESATPAPPVAERRSAPPRRRRVPPAAPRRPR